VKIFRIGLGILIFSLTQILHAGPRVGNGGGAWVCREESNQVRWLQLADLFEAKKEFNLNPANYSGTLEEIVDQALNRVVQVDPSLHDQLAVRLSRLNYLKAVPGRIIYQQDSLDSSNDFLFRSVPDEATCTGGFLNFEQVVNYGSDDIIFMNQPLFEALSDFQKAALLFHEVIYANRRSVNSEVSSVNSRRLNGLIFSNLNDATLLIESKKIHDVQILNGIVKRNLTDSAEDMQVLIVEDSAENSFCTTNKEYGWTKLDHDMIIKGPLRHAPTLLISLLEKLNGHFSTGIDPNQIIWSQEYWLGYNSGIYRVLDKDNKPLGFVLYSYEPGHESVEPITQNINN
jgi:hypothetical protein